MLTGCVPWPAAIAAEYRANGLWEGITLWEMLLRTAARNPRKVALVHGSQRIAYAELVATAERLAAQFVALGIRPLERVVVQLPNGPSFVHVYFALVRIGAIPVMALRAHRQVEILHFVRSSRAAGYVIPDVLGTFDYRPMAADVQRACPALRLRLLHVVLGGRRVAVGSAAT